MVIFKVGDDFTSIANAARRFLDQQDQMDARVHNVFAGHLRAIVGNMTVEEMIRDREKLTQLTRESSGTEMEKLGLIVDSLQIQEIDDPTGYITNLGRPHAAAVASQARINEAHADREATEQEQQANALKAQAVRDASIKQAGFQAEIDRASAQAKQAGPLTEATAHQEVVVQQTKVAELEAQREEQSLQATVRKSLSHGVTVQAAYTWSKALTDLVGFGANYGYPNSLSQQYGQAYFNRPQRFVASYSWDLPFGHPQ